MRAAAPAATVARVLFVPGAPAAARAGLLPAGMMTLRRSISSIWHGSSFLDLLFLWTLRESSRLARVSVDAANRMPTETEGKGIRGSVSRCHYEQ